jgi:dipeptidase D
MAVLASEDISHPAIEALFTVDEETGMTGAMGLKGGLLSGEILLNLDTEDDDEITIGCAGGVDVTARGRYKEAPPRVGDTAFLLSVSGLTGGHSGMDIHRGRGNANKLINRLLYLASTQFDLRIGSIDAGGLRNALPRESRAHVSTKETQAAAFQEFLSGEAAVIKSEYALTDPGLRIELERSDVPGSLLPLDFQAKLLSAIYGCPNGVFRMSPNIDGLVQTSNNLARVLVSEGQYEILNLARGSVDSEKMDLARAIGCSLELMGADVEFSGAYPGWAPRPDAPVISTGLPRRPGVWHPGWQLPRNADGFFRPEHPGCAFSG